MKNRRLAQPWIFVLHIWLIAGASLCSGTWTGLRPGKAFQTHLWTLSWENNERCECRNISEPFTSSASRRHICFPHRHGRRLQVRGQRELWVQVGLRRWYLLLAFMAQRADQDDVWLRERIACLLKAASVLTVHLDSIQLWIQEKLLTGLSARLEQPHSSHPASAGGLRKCAMTQAAWACHLKIMYFDKCEPLPPAPLLFFTKSISKLFCLFFIQISFLGKQHHH